MSRRCPAGSRQQQEGPPPDRLEPAETGQMSWGGDGRARREQSKGSRPAWQGYTELQFLLGGLAPV